MSSVAVPDYLRSLDCEGSAIACPLCGSWRQEPVYEGIALRGNELTCVICLDCTHLFLSPRPPMEAFKGFYEGESYFHLCANFSSVTLEEKLSQFDDEAFWRERFGHGERLHAKYLDGVVGPGDLVFDFGCGDGGWLEALRDITGCEVDGEEISDVYVDVVRKRLGVDIFLGPIEELGEQIVDKHEGKAALAIVSGSLQHMLDPMSCLAIAHRILRPGGLLYVCNWSLFAHYMTPYAGDRQRLLGEVLSWEHVHYFHAGSYAPMLERAGFEVLDFNEESEVRPRHMDAFARRAEGPVPVHARTDAAAVTARLRALESSTIAERLGVIGRT